MLMLLGQFCFGQKEGNVWLFGDSAGVDFNSTLPHAILNGMTKTGETSSSICDKNGNLLFYAGSINPSFYDNITIWNKNNQIIQNGSGLYGQSSITQGTLLLSEPESQNIIYLFHGLIPNIYCTIIDRNGDSGNGNVIVKNKILLQTDSITEKLIAIKHANGRDWWIIAHRSSNNTFLKYIFQKDTILGPFEQKIGSIQTGGLLMEQGKMGQMCTSKYGNKIVCVTLNGVVDIFDFDRCTGVLNNWIDLGDHNTEYYGCSISPDNSKLYISTGNEGFSTYQKLVQFDLNASNIETSKTLIYEYNNHTVLNFGQQQIGVDDKIYIAKDYIFYPNEIYDSVNLFLGVINNPNLMGINCTYIDNGLYLAGRKSHIGLPNIPNYSLGRLVGSACDTIPEPKDTMPVYYIPNIFSPNGDGQNDVFRLRSEQIASVHLQVYDRWGNKVFETNDMNDGWDGMYQGKKCEVGVYAWWAEILFKNGVREVKKGNVTLVR